MTTAFVRPRSAASGLALALAFALAPVASAQEEPVGEPVRWDQERVTQLAAELAAAVREARQAIRQSPLSQNIAQRRVQYDLKEDMRLLTNSTNHLAKLLEEGKGQEETRATFERIGSLRLQAEEHGRRAMIEAPVMDTLVRAGSIHNQMKPYYYGKR